MSEALIADFRHARGATSSMQHHHICYEIIYVRRGDAVFVLDSKTQEIGDETLVFISPYERHSLVHASPQYERYYIMFSPENMNRLIRNPVLTAFFRGNTKTMPRAVPAPALALSVFEEIKRELEQQNVMMEELISCKLNELLIATFRANSSFYQRVNSRAYHASCQIAEYIEEHYSEPLKMAELAQKLYIDKHHLSHIFTPVFGCSPKAYLQRTRLLHVKSLLLTTTLDLEEIAARTGFSDANTMIKIFKKEEWTTPGKFRKSVLESDK